MAYNICNNNNNNLSLLVTIENGSLFAACLLHRLKATVAYSLVDFSLVLVTTLANLLLIYLLVKKNCTHIVFDRILISHAFVDLITNLFDLPLYHFMVIFGYFPFNALICFYYNVIDNSTSTIAIVHCIYMAYARIRCVRSPMAFHREWAIRYSNQLLSAIWACSVIFWVLIAYYYSFEVFVRGQCQIKFANAYMGILIICMGYHLPLMFTVASTCYVIFSIRHKFAYKQRKNQQQITRLNRMRAFLFGNPRVKLSIIMFVFVACYFPYAMVLLVEAAFGEGVAIPDVTYYALDLIAYSSSTWNPILILVLNYKFFTKDSANLVVVMFKRLSQVF